MNSRLRHITIASMGLFISACGGSASPVAPSLSSDQQSVTTSCPYLPYELVGLRAIAADASWADWYSQAESCAQLDGNVRAVRWLAVDAIYDKETGDRTNIRAITCADDIYLTEREEGLVRHEILHHILNQPGHPTGYFPRCAELLSTSSL